MDFSPQQYEWIGAMFLTQLCRNFIGRRNKQEKEDTRSHGHPSCCEEVATVYSQSHGSPPPSSSFAPPSFPHPPPMRPRVGFSSSKVNPCKPVLIEACQREKETWWGWGREPPAAERARGCILPLFLFGTVTFPRQCRRAVRYRFLSR